MRMLRPTLLCLLLAATTVPAATVEEDQATFTALELKLLSAVQGKQPEVVEELVSPSFAWSLALEGRANAVMSRSEWIKGGDYYDLGSFDVSNLSAQTFGKLTVVHFRYTIAGSLGTADVTGGYVVTDLWEQDGKDWKLLRRFVSRPVPPPKGE
jgi:hypothetical protein